MVSAPTSEFRWNFPTENGDVFTARVLGVKKEKSPGISEGTLQNLREPFKHIQKYNIIESHHKPSLMESWWDFVSKIRFQHTATKKIEKKQQKHFEDCATLQPAKTPLSATCATSVFFVLESPVSGPHLFIGVEVSPPPSKQWIVSPSKQQQLKGQDSQSPPINLWSDRSDQGCFATPPLSPPGVGFLKTRPFSGASLEGG